MGVETKKMANSIAAASGSFGDRIKPGRSRSRLSITSAHRDEEGDRASFKEVQATRCGYISVFLFAAFFEVVGFYLSHSWTRCFAI